MIEAQMSITAITIPSVVMACSVQKNPIQQYCLGLPEKVADG